MISAAILAGAPVQAQTDDIFSVLTATPSTQRSASTQPRAGTASKRIEPVGGELALPDVDRAPLGGESPLIQRPVTPFGASLFEKQFTTARAQAINPTYQISAGDQVAVAVWGAWSFNGTLTVDLQGNIFIPEIGPIQVEGLTNESLDRAVKAGISRVFTSNVHSYTNLLTSQPVSVFVTGAILRPGRYAGARLDTLLYYLSAGGGVNPESGSYRNITVLRDNQVLTRVDLYDFMVNGHLPKIQFTDNDAIVIGPRGPTVQVGGEVRNRYLFEVAPNVTTGAQVMTVAAPTPQASHVAVSGIRDGMPYSAYIPASDFASLRVQDGDTFIFQADRVPQTIFVNVQGHSQGASSFAVRRNARLQEVLDLVEVDPDRAAVNSIYLRRKSAAERQARALELSLQELQRSVLLTSSDTSSEAAIRVQEAQLVERFIAQASAVQPEGRVVLAHGEGLQDLRLEPDDEIVIPVRSDVVLISGEVRVPQSLLFVPGRRLQSYIAHAGGFTERGDSDRYVVQRLNGAVETSSNPELHPGDHVMVLPKVDSKGGAVLKDIVEILYRIAVSSGVVMAIF